MKTISTRLAVRAGPWLAWLGALLGAVGCGSSAVPGPMCENGVTAPGQAGCSAPCSQGQVCNGGVCGAPVDAVAYQIDPAHTGALPGPALASSLCERWSVALSAPLRSYPVIAGGRVFVILGKETTGGTLRAFDLLTGKPAWGPVELGTHANTTYDGGKLFTLDDDGARAFDAATGAALWSMQALGGGPVSAPPTAAGGHLYTIATSGFQNALTQIDEATGKILWTVYGSMDGSAPTVGGGAVYVAGRCDYIASFDEATGAVRWVRQTAACSGGGGGATTVLFDDRLYVPAFGATAPRIVDAKTGDDVGTSMPDGVPAFRGGRGYFVTHAGALEARDVATLATVWFFPSTDDPIAYPPIAGETAIYTLTDGGRLNALDPETGDSTWSAKLVSPVNVVGHFNALAVSAGVLVVPGNGRLVAFW